MKRLIELANKLDNLGLTSEADAIDNMIKRSNWWREEWDRPEPDAPGADLAAYDGDGAGQGETILEGDVPEGEEPSVGGSMVYVVMYVAQGEGGLYTLRGVYTSIDKAEKAIEGADDSDSWGMGELKIQEMRLDSTEQIKV